MYRQYLSQLYTLISQNLPDINTGDLPERPGSHKGLNGEILRIHLLQKEVLRYCEPPKNQQHHHGTSN